MDATTTSLLIVAVPVAVAIVFFWFARKGKVKKREWFLIMGFISLSLFYIYAPDPSLVQKLYVENGDLTPVYEFGVVAAVFLFVSIYYFKKHLER